MAKGRTGVVGARRMEFGYLESKSVGKEFKRTKLKSLTAIRAFQYNLVLNHSMAGRTLVIPLSLLSLSVLHNIQRLQKLIYGPPPPPPIHAFPTLTLVLEII